MGRLPGHSSENSELKKGPWTPEEDQRLIDYIKKHGQRNWQLLPKKAGLNRCGKSCRLRWTNYLRPDIKRGNFTVEEEQTIIDLHLILGNKKIEGVNRSPEDVVVFASGYYQRFLDANKREKLSKSPESVAWHPPSEDMVKINFDGAIFKEEMEVGLGAVARDHAGDILAWRHHRFKGRFSSVCVEALAARLGVQLARDMGWESVVLEGDCSTVVHDIENDDGGLANHGVLIADIRRLCGGFRSFQVNHVRRAANLEAHRIARNAAGLATWWSTIAANLPGRTDNEIKNFWNTHLKKKLMLSGINPQTHQPIPDHVLNLPYPMHYSSDFNNLLTMKNPLEVLAKFQLLCNILQILNADPVLNVLREQNVNQYYHGISNPVEVFSTVPNLENGNPSFSNFEPVINTSARVPEFPDTNYEYSLPPATPEISSGMIENYEQILCGVDDEANSFWKYIFMKSLYPHCII